jgi:enoyl-CoA hydratase
MDRGDFEMADLVTYEQAGRVARIRLDDGKANVMSAAMLGALDKAFDRAAQERAVVVLSGRDNVFSAGFDLKTLRGGTAEEVFAMLRGGADLALKILSFQTPVISVIAGSAYPMGAFLTVASDWRIGAEGDWQIGFNEVQIGIVPPRWSIQLARQRIAPAHLSRTTVIGEMFAPAQALAAGFLDEVAPRADLDAAVERAIERMLSADPAAHAAAKRLLRGDVIATMRQAIDEDITLAFAEQVCARRAA